MLNNYITIETSRSSFVLGWKSHSLVVKILGFQPKDHGSIPCEIV